MRRILQGFVVAGLVAVLVAPAMAQQGKGQRKGQGQGQGQRKGQGGGFGQGGGMMMGGGAPMQILANSGVQKELKLTDEQVGKVTTAAREQMTQMRDRMQALQDATPEERRTAMTKYQAETLKTISDILKPEQMKRFDQIRYQTMYAAAFEDEKVASTLKITDDQKTKIRELQTAMAQEMRDSFQGGAGGGGGDREAMMAKMTSMRKANFDKALALLTSEQKAAWKDLIGEPFDYKPEIPGPRRID